MVCIFKLTQANLVFQLFNLLIFIRPFADIKPQPFFIPFNDQISFMLLAYSCYSCKNAKWAELYPSWETHYKLLRYHMRLLKRNPHVYSKCNDCLLIYPLCHLQCHLLTYFRSFSLLWHSVPPAYQELYSVQIWRHSD